MWLRYAAPWQDRYKHITLVSLLVVGIRLTSIIIGYPKMGIWSLVAEICSSVAGEVQTHNTG